MPQSAAITRAPATCASSARRADEIAAEKDGETAHGDGLYHAAAPERKARTRTELALAALPAFVLLLTTL